MFTLFANQILFETREKEDWITGGGGGGGGYKKTYVRKWNRKYKENNDDNLIIHIIFILPIPSCNLRV